MEKSFNIFCILILCLLLGSFNVVFAENSLNSSVSLDDSSSSSFLGEVDVSVYSNINKSNLDNSANVNSDNYDFINSNDSCLISSGSGLIGSDGSGLIGSDGSGLIGSDDCDVEYCDSYNIHKVKLNSLGAGINIYNSTIDARDLVKYYCNDSQLVVYLRDSVYFTPLANREINLNILGNRYLAVSDDFGRAFFDINFVPGKYEGVVDFTGDSYFAGSSKLVNIEVLKMPTNLTTFNLIKYYQNDSGLVAFLDDGDGNPLVNKSISFSIIGKTYKRITDEDGKVELDINLAPGLYNATIRFSEDYYHSSRKTVSVAVLDKPTQIIAYNLTKDYTSSTNLFIYLKDINFNPLSNMSVNLSFDGDLYNLITDDDGKAVFNLSFAPGTYKADLSFREKYFVNSSKTVYVNVLDLDPSSIHVSSDGDDELGDGSILKPYKSISKAVKEAAGGITIYIHNGTYSGNENINILIDKNLNFASIGGDVVIDGAGRGRMFNILDNLSVGFREISFTSSNVSEGNHFSLENISDLSNSSIVNIDYFNSADGGAIYSFADLNLSHCKFLNNSAMSGGAVYSLGKLFVDDCIFEDNRANASGGAIYSFHSNSSVSNSVFINNGAMSRMTEVKGGAIYNVGENFSIFGSTFDSNYARETSKEHNELVCGGAIANFAKGLLVNFSYFISNFAEVRTDAAKMELCLNDSYGGAIYTSYAENVNIINNRFVQDNAHCKFSNNYVWDLGNRCFGGAIACCANDKCLYLFNNTFINCSSSSGAVYSISDDSIIENNTFNSNFGQHQASSVYDRGNNSVYKGNTFIAYNDNDLSGTIVSIHTTDVTFENNTFKGSSENDPYTGNHGAAISIVGSYYDPVKTNVRIVNNYFDDNNEGISFYGVNGAHVLNNTFVNHNNSAITSYGGSNSDWNIIGNLFENNRCVSLGGAIGWVPKNSTVSYNSFINNSANYGGAICLSEDVSLTHNSFINNSALYSGGAIYSQYWSYNLRIEDNYFQDNVAVNGSAMSLCSSNGTVNNNVFNNTDSSDNLLWQDGDWMKYYNNTIYEKSDVDEELDYYINNHKKTPNDFIIIHDSSNWAVDLEDIGSNKDPKQPAPSHDFKYNGNTGYYDNDYFDKVLDELTKFVNELINGINSTLNSTDNSDNITNVTGGNGTGGVSGNVSDVTGGNGTGGNVADNSSDVSGNLTNSTVDSGVSGNVGDVTGGNGTGGVSGNVTNSTDGGSVDDSSGGVSGNVTNSTDGGSVDDSSGGVSGNVTNSTDSGSVDDSSGGVSGNVTNSTDSGSVDDSSGGVSADVSDVAGNVSDVTGGNFSGEDLSDFLDEMTNGSAVVNETINLDDLEFDGNNSEVTGSGYVSNLDEHLEVGDLSDSAASISDISDLASYELESGKQESSSSSADNSNSNENYQDSSSSSVGVENIKRAYALKEDNQNYEYETTVVKDINYYYFLILGFILLLMYGYFRKRYSN